MGASDLEEILENLEDFTNKIGFEAKIFDDFRLKAAAKVPQISEIYGTSEASRGQTSSLEGKDTSSEGKSKSTSFSPSFTHPKRRALRPMSPHFNSSEREDLLRFWSIHWSSEDFFEDFDERLRLQTQTAESKADEESLEDRLSAELQTRLEGDL